MNRPKTTERIGPRRLVLVRHGETDHNVARRAQGHLDVPLNGRGRDQARAVAPVIAAFKPAFVRSSDLSRARVTAEEIARHSSLEVESDPRLREFSVGINRQDRTWEEYAELFPEEAAVLAGEREGTVVGRETPAQVAARWRPALAEAAEAVPVGGCGVVVAHGASLRTGVIDFLGLADDAFHAFAAMDNCAWTVLEEQVPTFREYGSVLAWRLTAWNRTLQHP